MFIKTPLWLVTLHRIEYHIMSHGAHGTWRSGGEVVPVVFPPFIFFHIGDFRNTYNWGLCCVWAGPGVTF